MKITTFLVAVSTAMSLGTAQAATLDLSDNSFTSVDYVDFVQGPLGPIEEFVDTAAGVAFTISAKSVNGQMRNVGTWGNGTSNASGPYALSFGGGGGNTRLFTLTVDQDIILNAFLGFAQRFNTGAIFDVTGTGVSSIGNAFSTNGFLGTAVPVADSFVGGPLSLTAGETYTFSTTNNSPSTLSHLTALDFTVAGPSPVPLPAGLPLLAVGLAAFAVARRKA